MRFARFKVDRAGFGLGKFASLNHIRRYAFRFVYNKIRAFSIASSNMYASVRRKNGGFLVFCVRFIFGSFRCRCFVNLSSRFFLPSIGGKVLQGLVGMKNFDVSAMEIHLYSFRFLWKKVI